MLNVVTGLGAEVGEPLVTHPDVAHVGFTGGDAAGRRIYELAARGLKTVTLELGGKSPNIVFDDADLAQAVKGVVSGIFAASGQSCQAGSRLLVQESIHDRFIAMLVEFMRDVKLGDPALPDTQMGPISTRPQFEKILGYIDIGKQEGAKCVLGGRARPDLGSGWFVEPTIFTGVRNDMRIAQEEIFGPVLAVIPFKDEADAIRIGNDVRFGLAAAVWTKDLHRAMLLTDKLKAGTVWVNNYRATSFTSPFGGFKDSGHRPGVRNGRDQGVSRNEVRLDFDGPRRSQPVHPPLMKASTSSNGSARRLGSAARGAIGQRPPTRSRACASRARERRSPASASSISPTCCPDRFAPISWRSWGPTSSRSNCRAPAILRASWAPTRSSTRR